jgi:hypothetical protein
MKGSNDNIKKFYDEDNQELLNQIDHIVNLNNLHTLCILILFLLVFHTNKSYFLNCN